MNPQGLDRDAVAERLDAAGTDSFGEFGRLAVAGWDVRRYATLASTQDVAAGLGAWTAVVADSQSRGRGQWERSFTSDRGGLYMTAVLPFNGDAARWRGFALAIGWAIAAQFRARAIASLRLRWPNDLMIGGRKVGGILVSQGRPDTLCVGLGLNVKNRPWLLDPALRATACRLADFAREDRIEFDFLARALLCAVRLAHANFCQSGLGGIADALNQSWGGVRDVVLELATGAPSEEVAGRFQGILPNGDLLLEDSRGERIVVRSHLVKRLRES
jgi:BirA family biotin operon repressor/biotin-[acetyl-CoA-carboxylase] ligase